MIYTMRAGVDRQTRDKIASSILYGTGLVVAGFLAIAPFTGNNTFWNGGSNEQGSNTSSSGTSSKSLNATTSSKSSTSASTTAKTTPSSTASPQTTASKTASGSSATTPVSAGTITTTPGVVGRGGDGGTTTPTTPPTSDPLPVVTDPVNPSPTPGLPLTVCTPTTSLDPLLSAGPVCVN